MTSYTLQVQPQTQYTIEYANQRGPQGPTGPAGTGLSAIASGTILGNGLGDTALPQALNAVSIRTILDLATFDSPTFVGLTLSGLQQFTGTSTVGLRVKSLTTAEYNALTAANGDLFVDSTTDRIDARLARGTVELIDSAGGQTIGGTLQATALSESAIAATGTGGLVRATSPTLTTPNIGDATATVLRRGSTSFDLIILFYYYLCCNNCKSSDQEVNRRKYDHSPLPEIKFLRQLAILRFHRILSEIFELDQQENTDD
jgi:hypothetical protein